MINRILCLFLLICTFSKAQENNSRLENTDSSLTEFTFKLNQLSSGKNKKIKILHIGDSHVQPDNFTGEARRQTQKKFGNGGRGLVFPYSLAKTNGPKDFTITSNVQWINSWNINYPHKFNLGISGMGIQSLTSEGEVDVNLIKDSLKNPFIKAIVIFTMDKTGEISLNNRISKKASNSEFDTITLSLEKEQTNLKIAFTGSKLTIHGIYFENSTNGIIYNSAGVAGARYQDFNNTAYFSEQLKLFSPDLVIISLGTNESFDPNYEKEKFSNEVDNLIQKIKANSPSVNIILTLPSENYRVRKGIPIENATVQSVSAVLRTQAIKNNCAIWDLYKTMGGKGSMLVWQKEGLVNKDLIHFLRSGYWRQGSLLFEAIESLVSN
ncbi:MAG: GDSL-type esterase/lipase family protein [Crocinitomicaceae bacterium]